MNVTMHSFGVFGSEGEKNHMKKRTTVPNCTRGKVLQIDEAGTYAQTHWLVLISGFHFVKMLISSGSKRLHKLNRVE